MAEFYILLECEGCGEDIYYGICVTTLEHNGRPVIPFDAAGQTRFDCAACGVKHYTGDFEVFTDG